MSRIRSELENMKTHGEGREQGDGHPRQARPAFPRRDDTDKASPHSELERIQSGIESLINKLSANASAPVADPEKSAHAGVGADMGESIRTEIREGFEQMRDQIATNAYELSTRFPEGAEDQEEKLQAIAKAIDEMRDGSATAARIDAIHAEISALQDRLSNLTENAVAPDLTAVTERIESGYSDIVNRLDAALAANSHAGEKQDYTPHFHALSEQMQSLARSLETAPRNVMPSDAEGGIDVNAFDRIEARLASLAKSVDRILELEPAIGNADVSNGSQAVLARLESLGEEIGRLAGTAQTGVAGNGTATDLSGVESRLEEVFARLDELTRIADEAQTEDERQDPFVAQLDARLAAIAERLDAMDSIPVSSGEGSGQMIGMLQAISQRLDDLSHQSISHGPEGAAQVADFQVIEQQMAALMERMTETAANGGADLSPITDRLDNIEGQIASSRDIMIDMTNEAQARAGSGGATLDSSFLDPVMTELRAIRGALSNPPKDAADADEQLRAISERLAQMGTSIATIEAIATGGDQSEFEHPEQVQAEAEKTARSSFNKRSDLERERALDLQFEPTDDPTADPTDDLTAGDMRTEASAADDFDAMQLEREARAEGEARQRIEREDVPPIHTDVGDAPVAGSRTDKHNRAEAHRTDAFDLEASQTAAAMSTTPADDQAIDDVPLAPGSGMPDLDSLVKKAREIKRDKPKRPDGAAKEDDGISDLMAAARRAAQAASAEAETIRETEASKINKRLPTFGKLALPSFLNRKVLMGAAAVMTVAIAGLIAGPIFFGSGGSSAPDRVEVPQIEGSSEIGNSETAEPAEETALASEDQLAEESDLAENGGFSSMADENLSQENATRMSDAEEPASTASDAPPLSETAFSTEASTIGNAAAPADAAIASGLPREVGNDALLNAAAAGNGDALFEIARRFTDGDGVDRDLEAAARWYTEAAEGGHGPAQYRIGNFHEKGHGVPADTAKAADWYGKAASQGNALAMHNLAVLNAMGVIDGDANMDEAIAWFEKAANLGVKDSQVNLGILYTKGMGVEEDLESAYKWFAIAAKGGDTDAAKKRDTVAQAMRPEQLEAARGAAELWKPQELVAEANFAQIADDWKANSRKTTLGEAEMVRQTQMLLGKAGFDAGPADGVFGNRTRQAIMSFQKENRLPVDGEVSTQLLDALSKTAI